MHVGRVAVKRQRRGEGLGRYLMEYAFKKAKEAGAEAMSVSAQEDKSGFYLSCGFEPTGRRFFEQGNQPDFGQKCDSGYEYCHDSRRGND